MPTGPIRLYWWRARPNFGDALAPLVVSAVSGRPVTWAPLEACEMLALGSAYGWLRRARRTVAEPCEVWGAGIMRPSPAVSGGARVRHRLLRGPLTAMAAGEPDAPLGDPALLLSAVPGLSGQAKAHRVAIVPHWTHWAHADFVAALRAVPEARLVDVRSADPMAVVAEIARAELVWSASLHGLVVADALGIPSRWLAGPPIEDGLHDRFKFHDYGLAVGRCLAAPEPIPPGRAGDASRQGGTCADPSRVAALAAGIRAAFPPHMLAERAPSDAAARARG